MNIKLLIMDVDGTLTDGKIYMGENGEVFKAFSIKDGYGIHDILILAGVTPVIITGRKSKIVENRCNELGIVELYQGVHDKVAELDELVQKYGCQYSEVAYIGDDMNDNPPMEKIKVNGGLIGCPADAVDGVKTISDYICKNIGGNGAVREFIEWFLNIVDGSR